MTATCATAPVRRRLVYYLSGFDPRGARFYHQLYQSEAALQQVVDGCRYEVSGRTHDGPHATTWTVQAEAGEQRLETRYTFLGWDDIVRAHWPGRSAAIGAMPGFYWRYMVAGCLGQTFRCSPRFFWSLMAPIVFTAIALLLAATASLATAWLASHAGAGGWIALMLGLAVAAGTVALAVAVADRVRLPWVVRICLFTLQWGRTGPQPFEQRWAAFADKIQRDLAAYPADEVLVVGHSVGAAVAVAVVERWLTLNGGQPPRPGLVKLLTLGQLVPMLGLIPQAGWFRRQLAAVGEAEVPWLDYTAPSDPLSFALVDAFAACGLASPARASYRVRSARLDRMFPPAAFAPLKRDAFRIHFQYLMSTRLPVPNSYFRLTAGSDPLETQIRHAA